MSLTRRERIKAKRQQQLRHFKSYPEFSGSLLPKSFMDMTMGEGLRKEIDEAISDYLKT